MFDPYLSKGCDFGPLFKKITILAISFQNCWEDATCPKKRVI